MILLMLLPATAAHARPWASSAEAGRLRGARARRRLRESRGPLVTSAQLGHGNIQTLRQAWARRMNTGANVPSRPSHALQRALTCGCLEDDPPDLWEKLLSPGHPWSGLFRPRCGEVVCAAPTHTHRAKGLQTPPWRPHGGPCFCGSTARPITLAFRCLETLSGWRNSSSPGPPLVGAFFGPKENQMKCLIIASIMFGVAMLTVPGPAAAQFSAAQQAACGGDAQRLCSSSWRTLGSSALA
jgi:hypothetical protein